MTHRLVGLALIVFAYTLGALPIAYSMARRWAGVDLHEAGSGNVGATNVMRTAGWPLGLLVLVLDIAKGALAVWIAARVLTSGAGTWFDADVVGGHVASVGAGAGGSLGIAAGLGAGIDPALSGTTFAAVVALAGVAVIAGHVYPITLAFRGGKGVATSCGVFALLAPHAALLAVVAFAIVAWTTRYISLGSLAGAVVLPLACAASAEVPETLLAACAAAIIIVLRHRENLNRLHAGTEPRFGRQFTERS
jgi:glycerol-3-phosphate acyltransferase PlsY